VRGESFLLIAVAAQKFGARPSALVGLRDPVLALDFDLAAAARLLAHERICSAGLQPDTDPAEGDRCDSRPIRVREEHW
jgi:hypothetical protein